VDDTWPQKLFTSSVLEKEEKRMPSHFSIRVSKVLLIFFIKNFYIIVAEELH